MKNNQSLNEFDLTKKAKFIWKRPNIRKNGKRLEKGIYNYITNIGEKDNKRILRTAL